MNDFGRSWRDGNAFLAIVSSIKPGIEVETPMYTGKISFDHERALSRALLFWLILAPPTTANHRAAPVTTVARVRS